MMMDYIHPTRMATPSCIIFPANMLQIDLKSGMIHLIQTFHELENENPYMHIRASEEVVATFCSHNEAIDILGWN